MTNEDKFEMVFGVRPTHSGFIFGDHVKGLLKSWWSERFHPSEGENKSSSLSEKKLVIVSRNYSEEYLDLAREIFMKGLKMGYEKKTRHGKWIPEDDGFGGEIWTCSECGAQWTFNEDGPYENNARFCPECGADLGPIDGYNPENRLDA